MTRSPKDFQPTTACPAQERIAAELAGDGTLKGIEALSPAILTHLSKCASCRSMADQIQSVQLGLTELAGLDPGADLFDRASEPVQLASSSVASGPRISVRAERPTHKRNQPSRGIPSETEPVVHSTRAASHPNPQLRRASRMATAAVILVAMGWTLGRGVRSWIHEADTPPVVVADSAVTTEVATVEAIEFVEDTPPPTAHTLGSVAEPSRRLKARATGSPTKICHHDSPIEAADCEKLGCMHRAIIIPRMSRRYFGSTRRNSSPN